MNPTDLETRIALFLHRRLHKSQKILICKSDMELAVDIVALLNEVEDEENGSEAVRPRSVSGAG